jgi:hypothetical protein
MSFSRRGGREKGREREEWWQGEMTYVDGMKRWTGLMGEIHQFIGILKLKTPFRDN